MKKPVLIVLCAVLLAVLAYPAAAWFMGRQVESALTEQYKQVEAVPYMKVVKRDYRRGVFSSSETVTIELFGDMFRSLQKTQQQMPGSAPAAPLQFTVHSSIKHGPLPGLSTVAAAVSDSELVLDDKTTQELAKVLGDKKPLTAHTVYFHDGSGEATVTSPAFSTTFSGMSPGGAGRLSWSGLEVKIGFTKSLDSYTMQGSAPKLEVVESNGMQMVASGMHFEGNSKRIFADEPLLYSGTQKFTLAEMSIAGPAMEGKPLLLKQIAYDVNVPVNGEFIDMVVKLGAASAVVGGQDYGPVHYDFSVKRLHARTFAQLYRGLMTLYSNPDALTAGGNPAEALAPLTRPAMELLKHGPEIHLDRISFKSEHGEARVAGHVKFNDLKPEDFSQPGMLVAKLDAAADIALPENLLIDAAGTRAESAEVAQQRNHMLQQQLAAFVEQGFVIQEGAMLKSKLEFRNGQFTVNGMPFNPMAMGAGGGMPNRAAMQ